MGKDIPDIYVEYEDRYNPMIYSPNAPFALPFYQTRETMMDVEVYKAFLDNAISQFRHSVFYKNYKSHLMSLGLDHCQIMPNVTEDNVGAKGIEMNHNFLTIFDIALLITEHILNTVGYITTFDLIYLLKLEHKEHRVPIVMLSETVHQLYHQNDDFVLPAQMCFGYWIELLQKYNRGLTPNICKKVINYIDRSINETEANEKTIQELLQVRNNLEGWSMYNDNRTGKSFSDYSPSRLNYQYSYNSNYLE